MPGRLPKGWRHGATILAGRARRNGLQSPAPTASHMHSPVHVWEPKLAQALLPQLKQVGQAQLTVRARLLPGGAEEGRVARVGTGGAKGAATWQLGFKTED